MDVNEEWKFLRKFTKKRFSGVGWRGGGRGRGFGLGGEGGGGGGQGGCE